MLKSRRILLVLSLLLGLGSLAAALSYGLYLNGSGGRQALGRQVGAILGWSVKTHHARHLDWDTWAVEGLHANIVGHAQPTLHSERAQWTAGRSAPARLTLQGGVLTLGAGMVEAVRQWSARAGEAAGAGWAVLLEDFAVQWQVGAWSPRLGAARGTFVLDAQRGEHARLDIHEINGHTLAEPIHAEAGRSAALDGPGAADWPFGVRLPWVNLAWLKLPEPWPGHRVPGRVRADLNVDPAGRWQFSGHLRDVRLEDIVAPLWGARLSGRLQRAALSGRLLPGAGFQVVAGTAELRDIDGLEFSSWLGTAPLGGCLELDITHLALSDAGPEALALRGRWTGMDLAVLSSWFGYGESSGLAECVIRSLEIERGVILVADMEWHFRPRAGALGFIDQAALARLCERWLGIPVPNLPEGQLEFDRGGFRLLIDGPHVRVQALQDASRRELLTVRLLGRMLPVLRVSAAGVILDDCLPALQPGSLLDALSLPAVWKKTQSQITAPAQRTGEPS